MSVILIYSLISLTSFWCPVQLPNRKFTLVFLSSFIALSASEAPTPSVGFSIYKKPRVFRGADQNYFVFYGLILSFISDGVRQIADPCKNLRIFRRKTIQDLFRR